jgi:hypothetical protein
LPPSSAAAPSARLAKSPTSSAGSGTGQKAGGNIDDFGSVPIADAELDALRTAFIAIARGDPERVHRLSALVDKAEALAALRAQPAQAHG